MNYKKIILTITLLLLSVGFSNAQVLKYTELGTDKRPKGKFESYVAKDGSVSKVGDEINIGMPLKMNYLF